MNLSGIAVHLKFLKFEISRYRDYPLGNGCVLFAQLSVALSFDGKKCAFGSATLQTSHGAGVKLLYPVRIVVTVEQFSNVMPGAPMV